MSMFTNSSYLMDASLLKKILSIQQIHAPCAKHTHGHSVGGLTYVIEGLEKPVVVGDAIFMGSMGGGMFLMRMPCKPTGKNHVLS